MFSIRVEGGDELAAALNALSVRLSRTIVSEALLEAGEPMRKLIAQTAPREPGAPDLADNVNIGTVRRQPGEPERTSSVGIGVPKAFFYDWFQEFGTTRMRGRAFYRPAFDQQVQPALGEIGKILWRELAGRGVQRSVSQPASPFGPGRLL